MAKPPAFLEAESRFGEAGPSLLESILFAGGITWARYVDGALLAAPMGYVGERMEVRYAPSDLPDVWLVMGKAA